jgi:prepilin-type N-terminal cleavage/methylation domain-containing protein
MRKNSGFSLIEVLIVVTMIIVLSAFAIPSISGYMQVYTVRGGVREVVDEMQRARNMALKKNVTNGVIFFVANNRQFGYYSEDVYDRSIPAGQTEPTYQKLFGAAAYPTAVASNMAGPLRTLPRGLEFVATGGGNLKYVRFDNLGRACDPTLTTGPGVCPTVLAVSAPTPTVDANSYFVQKTTVGTERELTIRDTVRGITMTIGIGPGGRIRRPV